MNNKQKTVLQAIIYSDIFSFPLTQEEIWRYLGPTESFTREDLKQILTTLYPYVAEKKGYYHLSGRECIVTRRLKGEKEARRKLEIAHKAAKVLGYIPTIQLIGLSGNVASGSAAIGDDIDFFIVTKKNCLFTTRLIVLLVLELSGKRRRRNEKDEKDKICANFFIEETLLSFPRERHDLYTAREIAQLIPLFERNRMYGKFLTHNKWMKSFLPHTRRRKLVTHEPKLSLIGEICIKIVTLPFIETLIANWQLRMITKHTTNETVAKNFLAFHPRDYRRKTMQKFSRKCIYYESMYRKNHPKSNLDYVDKVRNIFYTA